MIQIAVCDDNLDELSNMLQLIDQYRLSKHLNCEYAAFQNGFELISTIEKGKRFTMYFLDIIMPAYTGIEVAKEIRRFDQNAPILFFTSSTEFALQSYSVKAINYVLKPVSKDKLFLTLDEVLERARIEDDNAFVVKSAVGIQKIVIANLVYAEVIGRNVLYHMLTGRVIECTDSFAAVCEKLLSYTCFIKTHRSYIVNMQYVDTLDNNQMILQTLESVPIAQGKAKEIRSRYLMYQMEE